MRIPLACVVTIAASFGCASTDTAVEAPGGGYHWGAEAWHPELPRGERVNIGTTGPMSAVLFGPSSVADGTMNIIGALRRSMATTGYSDIKEFQRVEMVVTA